MYRLCLDPGHGGLDVGATGNGIVEAQWVYRFCLALQDAIRCSRWPVEAFLTRDGLDISSNARKLSLRQRGAISASGEADFVLAIHVNSYTTDTLHGVLGFHWPGNTVGGDVMSSILRSWPSPLYVTNRGSLPTTNGPGRDDDWLVGARNVLKVHRATAGLLEVGYCTNKQDAEVLKDSLFWPGMIAGCLCGVARMLQLNA